MLSGKNKNIVNRSINWGTASFVMLATLTSLGFATPPTRPSSLPMKLIFLEAAHDGTTGQTSDETFVTRFDYVHAMLIPNTTTVGGGGESMMARGYDPGADQNIDGEINALDIAQFSLDYIDEVGAADANCDGEVTPADVDAFIDIHTANQQ